MNTTVHPAHFSETTKNERYLQNIAITLQYYDIKYLETVKNLRYADTKTAKAIPIVHHHHHFWQAPLRVRSAERRHQSPEWTVLRQVNCVVHIEVAGFQILLNGFHPCNTRTSQWSRPVSCGESC